MNLEEFLMAGKNLMTFPRMSLFVVFGLLTIFLDGGLMKKKGLQRESFWAKIIGGSLILSGVGIWLVFAIWG